MQRHRLAILDDYQRVARSILGPSALPETVAVETFDRPFADIRDAASALRGFDMVCLLRERTPFPAALLGDLPDLKFVCITGAHNRTFDFAEARKRDIVVSHTRNGASEFPTAEMTWALILAVMRNLPQEDRALRSGGWQTTIGSTLHGKTLGVIGLGRIGIHVAAIGRAFGMHVIGWSPNLTPERAAAAGVTFVTKDQLFAQSDVVALHMVLSDHTRHVVGAAEIARMRQGAVVVNTSRSLLIDEAALIEALRSGRIRAGLDVFSTEPMTQDHPFLSLKNVVLTPHLGFVTEEVYSVFFQEAAENIRAYLSGRPIRVLSDTHH